MQTGIARSPFVKLMSGGLLAPALAVIAILAFGIESDSNTLAPVGSSYWPIPQAIRLYLNHSAGSRTGYFILYLAGASLLGTLAALTCIRLADDVRSRFVLMIVPLAGFVPGYLILICLNRLTTLLASNEVSHWLLPWLYALAVGTLGYTCRGRCAWRPGWVTIFGGLALSGTIFFCFLVLQVQLDNSAHVLGDGLGRFLPLLMEGVGLAPGAHFPIFLQHYDEVMFLYPFLDAHGNDGRFIELFWMLYAYGRAAAFAAVMLAVFCLCRSIALSVLVAMFLFFGSAYLYTGDYILLFDSGNPLRQNLHVGRVILAVLPVIVLGLACSGRAKLRSVNNGALLLLVLVGLGASALSSSVLVLALSVGSAIFMLRLPLKPEAVVLSMVVTIASLLVAYAQIRASFVPEFFALGLAFSLLILLSDAGIARRTLDLARTDTAKGLGMLLAGLVLGLLLTGNSTARGFIELFGIDRYRRIVQSPYSIPPFSIGGNPFCGQFLFGHCNDLHAFLKRFSLVLMLPAISLWALSRSCSASVPAPEMPHAGRQLTFVENRDFPMLATLIVVCLLFVALGFFMYDFTNGAIDTGPDNVMRWLPVWLKSRLVEPWVYTVLAFSICSLWQTRAGVGRTILAIFVAWQVVAYCFYAKPPIHLVFLRNLSYLIEVAR